MDNQDLDLTKKLLYSYKDRLEREIIKRSNGLRIPENILLKTISENKEIDEIEKTILKLEKNSPFA